MNIRNFLLLTLSIFLINCQGESAFRIPPADSDNGGLFLPEGFGALVVVDSVGESRHIAVNTNGDIYVKLRINTGDKGNAALRDTNGDGKADVIEQFGDLMKPS